jgi:hypothetical protein
MAQMQEQVSALLEEYRYYHFHGSSIKDAEEKEDAKKAADVAKHTFLAMFRGKLVDEEFLQTESKAAIQRVLTAWVHDLYPSTIAGSTCCETAHECSELLVRLSSEPSEAQEPAVWPFVRVIKFVDPLIARLLVLTASGSI